MKSTLLMLAIFLFSSALANAQEIQNEDVNLFVSRYQPILQETDVAYVLDKETEAEVIRIQASGRPMDPEICRYGSNSLVLSFFYLREPTKNVHIMVRTKGRDSKRSIENLLTDLGFRVNKAADVSSYWIVFGRKQ